MLHSDIDAILNAKGRLLTEIYFDLQRRFEAKYGPDTVVFMEIGSFFETYEVNNDEMQIGKAKEMAELLNLQLTKKTRASPRTPSPIPSSLASPPSPSSATSADSSAKSATASSCAKKGCRRR